MDLACLAADVKLGVIGRQPTLFPSFFFFFLINTSHVDFHEAYFYYTTGVVLCFSGHAFLSRSLGEYN
jgi:hypothetical protein